MSLIKLIKDFKLENGLSHAVLKQEIHRLVKAINTFILKVPGDLLTLSFDGFVAFLLQYSYFHWGGNDQRAYSLMEKLAKQMRESALYEKMGLVNTQTESTARTDVKILG